MFHRNLLSAAVFSAALFAAPVYAEAAPCSLGQYAPVQSEPYRVQYVSDFGDFSLLQGAQLYVPAQPGLTREWLAHEVKRALASDACQPQVQKARVEVVSAGAGFWVLVSGADEREGAELSRWAASLASEAR